MMGLTCCYKTAVFFTFFPDLPEEGTGGYKGKDFEKRKV